MKTENPWFVTEALVFRCTVVIATGTRQAESCSHLTILWSLCVFSLILGHAAFPPPTAPCASLEAVLGAQCLDVCVCVCVHWCQKLLVYCSSLGSAALCQSRWPFPVYADPLMFWMYCYADSAINGSVRMTDDTTLHTGSMRPRQTRF